MSADCILRGSFSVSDERHYAEVPFTVPPGVKSLHVEYDYSERISSDPRLTGGNTLDIGLFDPNGFRGWSGSHKRAFSLSEDWATPAYVAGPIPAGVWQVLLGAYKVSPRGCEYQVDIWFGSDRGGPPLQEPFTVAATRPVGIARADDGWLRGDLHCHTLYSDGDSWPAEMLAHAVERGLDFLGVTDHNHTSHHQAYVQAQGTGLPIVLPGIEVTTYSGHWNAWGTDVWLDFREGTDAAVSRVMHLAAMRGAVVSVNHPKPFGPAWAYPNATGFHCVEVWNGAWPEQNEISLAWWDRLLRSGRRVVAVGGSDTHRLKAPGDRLGFPTTWSFAGRDRSAEGVLNSIRNGRVFISHDVDGPQVYLAKETVRVVGARSASLLLLTETGVQRSATIPSDDWTTALNVQGAYLRVEVRDPNGEMLALSNPVWSARAVSPSAARSTPP